MTNYSFISLLFTCSAKSRHAGCIKMFMIVRIIGCFYYVWVAVSYVGNTQHNP
jgi:hypothetical protein